MTECNFSYICYTHVLHINTVFYVVLHLAYIILKVQGITLICPNSRSDFLKFVLKDSSNLQFCLIYYKVFQDFSSLFLSDPEKHPE